MSYEYKYTTEGSGPYSIKMNIDISDDLEWIAQECAEDFHNEHDGWESRWPRNFTLLDDSGNELGTFKVDREYEPSFVCC